MKKRIDILITEKGLASSREKAKSLIKEGKVFIGGELVHKPGDMVDELSEISVREQLRYVSRGGLKLEKAIELCNIELKGKTCADIGASTGGFTDCMLQNGAKRVYSVDVGHDQLDMKLINDSRVTVLDRTNARLLDRTMIPDNLDFISVDVAFISLKLIVPAFVPLMSDNSSCVLLIKPQFEAGRESVGRGVIHDPEIHKRVIEEIVSFAQEHGLYPFALTFSPIKGPKGNIEFLLYAKNTECDCRIDTNEIVKQAHDSLNGDTE